MKKLWDKFQSFQLKDKWNSFHLFIKFFSSSKKAFKSSLRKIIWHSCQTSPLDKISLFNSNDCWTSIKTLAWEQNLFSVHSYLAVPTKVSVLFSDYTWKSFIIWFIAFVWFLHNRVCFFALFKLLREVKKFSMKNWENENLFSPQLSPFISKNAEWERKIQMSVAGVSFGDVFWRMSRTVKAKWMLVPIFIPLSSGDERPFAGRNIKCKFLA